MLEIMLSSPLEGKGIRTHTLADAAGSNLWVCTLKTGKRNISFVI